MTVPGWCSGPLVSTILCWPLMTLKVPSARTPVSLFWLGGTRLAGTGWPATWHAAQPGPLPAPALPRPETAEAAGQRQQRHATGEGRSAAAQRLLTRCSEAAGCCGRHDVDACATFSEVMQDLSQTPIMQHKVKQGQSSSSTSQMGQQPSQETTVVHTMCTYIVGALAVRLAHGTGLGCGPVGCC